MGKRTFILKKILFGIILILLVLPVIRNTFNFPKIRGLKGAFEKAENVCFSKNGWFSGDYQVQKEKYLNENFGYRNIFVRINNQIEYTLFDKPKAKGVIYGKDNYLYEENYIKAYYGTDFIGVDSISHRMEKLKYVSDTLSKLNKNIVLIFAAGKGSYYPEFIPDSYKTTRGPTNYEWHIRKAKELGLNYIDFNKYFIDHKYTSKYPLYSQVGIHWSFYGMCLVADSIVKYMEKLRNIDMPDIYWDQIDREYAKNDDYDIAIGLNLIFKIKRPKMAYPKIKIESDIGKTKPSVLVISDSYYWGMYSLGKNKIELTKTFSENHFWFYNQQVYPESFKTPLSSNQLDLKDEIAKHDVIIIMATDANLPGFGWGFIEKAYTLFGGK